VQVRKGRDLPGLEIIAKLATVLEVEPGRFLSPEPEAEELPTPRELRAGQSARQNPPAVFSWL
jgi:transcriptional regulator with XRE-family HTH domain